MGTLTTASPICSSPQLRSVGRCHGSMIQLRARPVGLCARAHLQARPMRLSGRFSLHQGRNPSKGSSLMQYASITWAAAALSAGSKAEQTQTVISKDPTIIHLPGEKISPHDKLQGGSSDGGLFLWGIPGLRPILCSRLGLWLFGLYDKRK